MAVALVAFGASVLSSCSDDDNNTTVTSKEDLVLTEDTQRVKIGEENRIALPVEKGNGDYNAFSLDPNVAKVVTGPNGEILVEGVANGMTQIVVSDAAGLYKKFTVSVYTTETLYLTHSAVHATAKVGASQNISGVGVELGNGVYSVVSNSANVIATINEETGDLTIRAYAQEQPETATVTVTDQSGCTADVAVNVAPLSHKVKIGTDTRYEITDAGVTSVESLQPTVAEVVEENGKFYVFGKANGVANIKIMADGNIKQYAFSVYTTDKLKLNQTTLAFTAPMGIAATNVDVEVSEGNGQYEVSSNDPRVTATIGYNDGILTIKAKPGKTAFSAVLTVSDCTGLTADLKVDVTPTFDPFTQEDINGILVQNTSTLYGQCKDPSDGTQPYYFRWWKSYGYGTYTFNTSGSDYELGWWMNQYGNNYGGLKVTYPSSATVNQEVSAKLNYQYSVITWYDNYEYNGTAKILEDNATRIVVIFWNVDMDNECINRAYFVYYK